MPIKTYKKNLNDCIIFCYKKKSWNELPKQAWTWDYILKKKSWLKNIFSIIKN